MTRKWALAFVGALLLSNPAWAENPAVKAIAEGDCYLGDVSSISEARNKAVYAAENAALEQGAGGYQSALPADKKGKLIKGYVKDEKFLQDELNKEELTYRVKIEVQVVYAEDELEGKPPVRKREKDELPWRSVLHPRGQGELPSKLCALDKDQLKELWLNLERVRQIYPDKYLSLLEAFYPNVVPEKMPDHLGIVRNYNPQGFEQVMKLVFPKSQQSPRLEDENVRQELVQRLKQMKEPGKYLKILQLVTPHFNVLELKKRLERACENSPQSMGEIERLLRIE